MSDAPDERLVDAATLPLQGQPLHTRTLVVDVFRETAKSLRAVGELIDLRKCDFAPLGVDLQTAGFIHQMKIAMWLDPQTRVIQRLEIEQPHIAYEADAAKTGGECCRDPAPALQGLIGGAVDAGFPKRLSLVFGGPLGCSHLLTLAQLMGNALITGLDREEARAAFPLREDGERIFKRALILDGAAAGEQHIEVAIQQSDFDMKPRVQVEQFLDRLERQHEVRVHGRVAIAGMGFTALDAAERTRAPQSYDRQDWSRETELLAPLVGNSALGGLSGRLFGLVGRDTERAALLDALLQFAPGLMQCLAATSGRWIRQTTESSTATESGGPSPGSHFSPNCYMWRENSPMQRMRKRGERAQSKK